MDHTTPLVALVVVAALAFDFTNGFHDTANAMATSIATHALRPKVAVLISGVLNLAGAFLSTEVARTISGGIVDESLVTPGMIYAGLVGAIMWNLTTWLLGLPSSSSHALFGGLIGAVWVGAGRKGVNFEEVVDKILLPAVASPFVAGLAAFGATSAAYRITRRSDHETVTGGFRHGQIASASLVSLAHGTNDAQKTMGVITLTLISSGALAEGAGPPVWVILTSGLAIALGTYLGGWRIIRTMGRGLVKIESPQGFAAESGAATVILTSANLGFALSTTQVASSGILGAGAARGLGGIRWGGVGRMVMAWLVTLPAAASVGAAAASAVVYGGTLGTVLITVAAVAAAAAIVALSRRNPVNARNVNLTEKAVRRRAPRNKRRIRGGEKGSQSKRGPDDGEGKTDGRSERARTAWGALTTSPDRFHDRSEGGRSKNNPIGISSPLQLRRAPERTEPAYESQSGPHRHL